MGFAGAHYTIEFVMIYGVVWIIFLNVLLLYTIFLCKANGSCECVQPPLILLHHFMNDFNLSDLFQGPTS